MSTESDSDVVSGVNASKFENGAAQKSETLANDPLVEVTKRKDYFSTGKNDIDKRNGVSDVKNETESVDRESDFESENDSDFESENIDCVGLVGNENLKLSESDLVWGKIRSYPWWPGQVIDASLASKKAKKHFKKRNSLVAYFGDSSFAWNDVSMIKPFHEHFSEKVNQSNSESFRDAIVCALAEVSRRVEFGLSCGCMSEEAYKKIKTQNIVNTGIHEDSRVRYGGDELSNGISFEPGKLVEYMKHLACFPSYNASDELQYVTIQAQLLAFRQWRGYSNFIEYGPFIKSVESGKLEASLLVPNTDEAKLSKKRKTDFKENDEHEDRDDEKTKEKTLSGFTAKKSFESRSIEKSDGKLHSKKKRNVESLESDQSEKKIKNIQQTDDLASQNTDEETNLSVDDANKLQKDDANKPCSDHNSTSKLEAENKKTKKPKHEELVERKISAPDEMLLSPNTAKTREGIPESNSMHHSNYEEFDKFLQETACSNLNGGSKKGSITETGEPTDVKDITGSKEQRLEDRDDEQTKKKTLSDFTAKKSFESRSIEKSDGKLHSEKKRKVESWESEKSEKKIKNNLEGDSASQNTDEETNLSVDDANKLQKETIPLEVESEMTSSTPAFESFIDSKSTTKVEAENEKPKHEEDLAESKISSPDEMLLSLHTAETREGVPKSFRMDHSNYEEFDNFLKEIACTNLNDDSKKVIITETAEATDVKDITGSEKQTGIRDYSADSTAPNSLILLFADSGSVPSEEKLNSIFNRYGPLRESETQVMKKSKRAKVMFKRGEDAKTAFSSARKYSIFGPSLLGYKLKYVCPKAKQTNNMNI